MANRTNQPWIRGIRCRREGGHGTIVVTGGCGFIGANLVFALARKGKADRLVVIDNLSVGSLADFEGVLCELGEVRTGQRQEEGAGVGWAALRYNICVAEREGGNRRCIIDLHRHDIRDRQGLVEMLAGAGAVVHLAAQTGVIPSVEDPFFDMEQNIRGTLNLLESCRVAGVKRFVLASSSAPLGEQEPPVHENKVPRPISPYGASKLAGEAYCSAYAGSFGLETIALRFSNVYGPRSTYKNSVVARFIKNIFLGQPLTIFGTGGQTRDFIFMQDLLQAIERSLETSAPAAFGSVFQIATFRETTVNELAEKLRDLAVTAGRGPVEIRYAAERAGEIRRSFSDISRARSILGFEPRYDLARGLEETWKWFLERHGQPGVSVPGSPARQSSIPAQ